MKDNTREEVIKIEEIKAIKLFLYLFYIMFIGFDLAYYYLFPLVTSNKVGLPDDGLGFFMHIGIALLLPISIYLMKQGKPFSIKYIYLITFLIAEFINNFLIYWHSNEVYSSGNIVEILFILFAPIFVNKRFLWNVSILVILKYTLYGLLFNNMGVVLPIALMLFFTIVGFILLTRFSSYINGMISAYEESKKKEKLAVVGQMAASIAHEIRNPLSALKGFTQLQQEKDESQENYYPIMLNEIDRINLIVSDLLVLGKPNINGKKITNIEEIIRYVVSIIEPQAVRQFIDIQIKIESDLPDIYGDENQLKQVFINLIKNSVESMQNGGSISITVQVTNGEFIISVIDEGEGIPKDILDKLGDAFFTTKPNGTGLGLMVTKKIIEEHGGKFVIQSSSEEGTKINVVLPSRNN